MWQVEAMTVAALCQLMPNHSTWPNSINPGQIPLENGILVVAPFLLGPQGRKVRVSHSFYLPVSYVSDAHTWKARKKRQVSLCLMEVSKYALHKIWKIVLLDWNYVDREIVNLMTSCKTELQIRWLVKFGLGKCVWAIESIKNLGGDISELFQPQIFTI